MSSRRKVIHFVVGLLLLVSMLTPSMLVNPAVQTARADNLANQSAPTEPQTPSHSLVLSETHTVFIPMAQVRPSNRARQFPLPYLQLAPLTHLDVIPEGLQITAYGRDFCTDIACSPVSIRVGDRVAVENVEMSEDGTFEVSFGIPDLVGEYYVTAYQMAEDGTLLEASLPLVVPIGDHSEENPPPPIPSQPLFQGRSSALASVSEFQPDILWGGRTVAVDIDPGNPMSALAATESGGVFRTTDGGATWAHVGSLPPFRLSDLRVDPNNAQNVLVTANSDSRTSNGAGIWRSTDGGTTWSKPATADPPPGPLCSSRFNAWGIAFVPGSGDVFVGTDCGVAVSNDSGATWTHIVPDATITNRAVFAVTAQAGASGSIVDICAADGHHRSTDSGLNWTPTGSTLPGCIGTATHAISGSPIESNVIFATTTGPVITCGTTNRTSIILYESDDGGTTWNTIITGSCPNRPPAVHARPSRDGDPTHIDVYYSNGVNTVRQTCNNTGGPGTRCTTTWDTITYDHTDHMDLAFNPADDCPVYLASDAGVHTTGDCGANWTIAGGGSDGFNALQVYEMTGQVHPDHTDLYFGTQDNDIWASADNGVTWPGRVRFEGFFLQIPHSSPSDAGQTFTGVACGPCGNFMASAHLATSSAWNNPPGGGGNPFLVEPGVYIQFSQSTPPTNTLYLSTDTGATWNIVPGGAVNLQLSGRPYIAGPASDPTIYQAVARPGNIIGLIKITGVRSAAATVSNADTGLNNIGRYCMGQGTFVCPRVFTVDPNDAQHLLAVDIGTNEIKVSTDGGNSWPADDILTNLIRNSGEFLFSGQNFGVQVHVITFDPTNSNRILVGTEAAGVFATLDGGQTWSHIGGSEQVVNASSFFFDEVTDTVLASSYGRGLWELSLDLPVADAGGPYVTDEGTNVVLDASGSSDPDGGTLTFEWDLDNDGDFDDATGANPTFETVGQDGVYTVSVKVTASDGDYSVASSTVTVNNVAPTAVLGTDAPQDEGSPVAVFGVISDPGWLDPLSAVIDWGDGTPGETISGVLENIRPDATLTFSVTHIYGDNGVFTATVSASDDDVTVPFTIPLQIDNVDPTAEIDETGAILINGVPTFLGQVNVPMDFSGRSTDPGSDDLYLSWDWDDGPPSPDVTTTYLVNPPLHDPFPSPSIQPRDITDTQTHTFTQACLYEISFLADDDDGGHGEDQAFVLIVNDADPVRTAGYWLHQYRGNGFTEFDEAELQCYLDMVGFLSQVFHEVRDASTIPLAVDVLKVDDGNGSMEQIFERQLLAVWLNFVNGSLTLDQMVDTDGDGTPDTTFASAVAAAEAVRLDPTATRAELEYQKDIIESINMLDE